MQSNSFFKSSGINMLKIILQYKWFIIIIFSLIIIEPTLNSVLNFWLQRLFNAAIPGTDKFIILRLLTIGFLFWMVKRIVTFSTGVIKSRFICNVKRDIKKNMFTNLLSLETSNLSDVAASGEYISLFTNDILLLEQRFLEQIIVLVSAIFSIVIMGSSFLVLNRKIAGSILILGLIVMLVPAFFSSKLNEKNLQYSNAVSTFTQKLKEYLVAYPTVKNYSIEPIITAKFNQFNSCTEDAKFNTDYTLNVANNVGMLLSWFMQIVCVGIGLMLVVNGEVLLGTVVAAQSFTNDLGLPMQNLVASINSIRSVKEIVEKLDSLSCVGRCEIGSVPQGKDSQIYANVQNQRDSKRNGCEVKFSNLKLEIDGNQIIKNFSYTFERGKKYLVIGMNGSGKSSIFKALKKWFVEFEGNIFIDGRNIRTMTNEEISRIVSYLNENVSLFSGSIRENITLFRTYLPEQFNAAVSDAHVNLNMDRTVGDEGRNISSGEQRRIEIARSLLDSVSCLIFDEVVSTLDIETAYEIEKLALGLEDKTVIFVSHNFSGKLIRQYDEILIMDGGKLHRHGTYDELLQSCDYFKRICNIKFG